MKIFKVKVQIVLDGKNEDYSFDVEARNEEQARQAMLKYLIKNFIHANSFAITSINSL